MTAVVPEDADLAAVTAVIANGVAGWLALHRLARLQPRDRVLVLGASRGIGATTCRMAALFPAAQVIGVVSGDVGREVTGDGTVDVVIDPVGGSMREVALARLAPFGRHILVGNASGADAPFSGDECWLQTRLIAGLNVGGIAHVGPDAVGEALAAVVALVARGALQEPAPAIESLEDAAAVHHASENRTAPGKTLLAVAGSCSCAGYQRRGAP